MLMDKRHVYDINTRVPLLVRGPGILPGSALEPLGTHADLAPTILAMAGVGVQSDGTWVAAAAAPPLAPMDGRSLLPLLIPNPSIDAAPTLGSAARAQLEDVGDPGQYANSWRTSVLIEHVSAPASNPWYSPCLLTADDAICLILVNGSSSGARMSNV